MNREEIIKELTEIFIDNFDNDDLVLSEDMTHSDIEGWDSIEQIHLVMAIERQWNIKFDIDEIASMKNVGEIINAISKKI